MAERVKVVILSREKNRELKGNKEKPDSEITNVAAELPQPDKKSDTLAAADLTSGATRAAAELNSRTALTVSEITSSAVLTSNKRLLICMIAIAIINVIANQSHNPVNNAKTENNSELQDIQNYTQKMESQDLNSLDAERKGITDARSRVPDRPLDASFKADFTATYDETLKFIDATREEVKEDYQKIYPTINNGNHLGASIIKDQINNRIKNAKITIEQVYRLTNQTKVKIKRTKFKDPDTFQGDIAEMAINGRRAGRYEPSWVEDEPDPAKRQRLTRLYLEIQEMQDADILRFNNYVNARSRVLIAQARISDPVLLCDPEFESSAEY